MKIGYNGSVMTQLLPFFIVLFAGLFFSDLFAKLHLPWVVALIVAGILIGPSGFGVFEPNATIDFMGEIGLVFLMFMAGLETRFPSKKEIKEGVGMLTILNSLIPFIVGLLIGHFFGLGLTASFLIGIIFISSSVAVIVPSLQSNGLFKTKVGKTIIRSTVIQDVLSLVLLSVVLQSSEPVTSLPLPLFYFLLFLALGAMRFAIPRIRKWLGILSRDTKEMFQDDLRILFVIMIGTVIVFELLGLHPIIAGFFAGMVLSHETQNEKLKEKLRAISYGIFIPIFFVVVGSRTDLSVIFGAGGALLLTGVIVLGSSLSKYISGWIGARLAGFSVPESNLVGASTMPALSTTLAAAFAGFELGILDENIITALVVLSIITTFVAPILMRIFSSRIPKTEYVEAEVK
jgi:Kef-type K+ transport system membrane component KefB